MQRTEKPPHPVGNDPSCRQCAVIVNPTKVDGDFIRMVATAAHDAGFEVDWLETRADDPGRAMAAEAAARGVDLVVAAGGDGTVRAVAAGLVRTGIPMGIIPAGTGNLLAETWASRLDERAALDVALSGRTSPIDTVELSVDDHEPDLFVVMAGTGLDAMIMDEVDERLKSTIGSAAYFVAAGKALGRLPIPMEISVDGRPIDRREAVLCVVGNVGELTGGITLIPQARANDGLLHVYVASPGRPSHWGRLLLRLVTRRTRGGDRVDLWHGQTVEIRLLRDVDSYQLDGDVVGQGRVFRARVLPGVLAVRCPL